MNTHNICFNGEIRKILTVFGRKKHFIWSFAEQQIATTLGILVFFKWTVKTDQTAWVNSGWSESLLCSHHILCFLIWACSHTVVRLFADESTIFGLDHTRVCWTWPLCQRISHSCSSQRTEFFFPEKINLNRWFTWNIKPYFLCKVINKASVLLGI